ncbi:MAG TPA: DUF3011 domain-containing protein [Casimicrobiaceae bacterium]|nr:DUF3011 domain-containing protein [Casimicrobiaceae bacterium]
MRSRALFVAAFVLLLGAPLSASAARLFCESRDYHRNYCPAGGSIASARLVAQQSRSACIQGRTWGHDNRGIWVTQGCSGEFDFRWSREPVPMPGPGRQIACESRNFQQNFCPSQSRITRAWLVEQRSRSACVQGRSWGFQETGIWVSSGCNGVFGVEGGGRRPNPPPVNRVTCESRNYQDAFCPVRPLIARAWLDEQRSQTTCIQGETWGFQGNGIWVSGGCSGVFAFQPQ